MEQQWEFSVSGRAVTFSAADANGKTFIRANGRAVAQPLAPGDQERLFSVEGGQFRLSRSADGVLDLQMIAPEPAVEAAPNTPGVEPVTTGGWSLADFVRPETAPVSVVFRGRVYFAVALLLFIYSVTTAIRIQGLHDRFKAVENGPRIEQRTDYPRGAERLDLAAALMVSAFVFEAILAFAGMAAAGFLIGGFRWASAMLEALTWLMFVVVTVMMMRIDRLTHVQLNAAYDPLRAAVAISGMHRRDVAAFIFAALVTGGLLQLVGHRSIDPLYDEESY